MTEDYVCLSGRVRVTVVLFRSFLSQRWFRQQTGGGPMIYTDGNVLRKLCFSFVTNISISLS